MLSELYVYRYSCPNTCTTVCRFSVLKLAYANVAELFVALSPCDLHMSFGASLGIALGIVPWLSAVLVLAYALVRAYERSTWQRRRRSPRRRQIRQRGQNRKLLRMRLPGRYWYHH